MSLLWNRAQPVQPIDSSTTYTVRHGVSAAVLFACSALMACGSHTPPPVAEILNVYNWADFIGEDTITGFERESGIKVHYSTYESDDVLETKLLTGRSGYDLVVPSTLYFGRLVRAHALRQLDKAALPFGDLLYPDIMRDLAGQDPGNLYGVPYLWSTTGIGYNVPMISQRLGSIRPDSWSLILDPLNAAKLKDCGIMIVDSPQEVYAAVLLYLGKDPNTADPADLHLAADTLMKIRPYVRTIASEGMVDAFANGSLCAILGWAGDLSLAMKRAREASAGLELRYYLPREGTLLSEDVMAIPADAPNFANAQKFMNFVMRPKVMADITNAVRYPNAVPASLPFIDAALKSDAALYPDAEARAGLHVLTSLSTEQTRLVTRLWTRFRTGE